MVNGKEEQTKRINSLCFLVSSCFNGILKNCIYGVAPTFNMNKPCFFERRFIKNPLLRFPLLIMLLVISGCKYFTRGTSHDFIIVDITKETGFGGPIHSDSLGGHGIMWCDVTKNGYPDVYTTMNWKYPGFPYPELFYLNNGQYNFIECAKKFGIDDVDGGSHGAVFADLNNNGYFDLINSSTLSIKGGPNNNSIYENINGEFIEFYSGYGKFSSKVLDLDISVQL